MKAILVATNFSEASKNAARYAASLAVALEADLVLLNVYTIPVSYMEIPVIINIEGMQQDAELLSNELKHELDLQTGVKIHVSIKAEMGNFFEALKINCEKINPSYVIMGSQGTTATERLLYSIFSTPGSVGLYSRAELGLQYINDERTFSISGSIGVERSSYPVLPYNNTRTNHVMSAK